MILSESLSEFRFRPQFRALPIAAAVVGLALLACIPLLHLSGLNRAFALGCAIGGPLVALLYLAAPAWQFRVIVDETKLAVHGKRAVRFELPWANVRKVICAPASHTCFVDGGEPQKSLLVPGPGAPAPYRIDGREALYDFIVAHVPAERRQEVATLDAPGVIAKA